VIFEITIELSVDQGVKLENNLHLTSEKGEFIVWGMIQMESYSILTKLPDHPGPD